MTPSLLSVFTLHKMGQDRPKKNRTAAKWLTNCPKWLVLQFSSINSKLGVSCYSVDQHKQTFRKNN